MISVTFDTCVRTTHVRILSSCNDSTDRRSCALRYSAQAARGWSDRYWVGPELALLYRAAFLFGLTQKGTSQPEILYAMNSSGSSRRAA